MNFHDHEVPEGLEPILDHAGHFHIDAESEKSSIEQISEIIELILFEMKENNAPWDEWSEIWMVMLDPPEGLHASKWEHCPLKNVPTLMTFDPFKVAKFAMHPADLLAHSITTPGESGVFLLLEAWAISPEDLEEGDSYENWHGRTQDHPKAKEWRQLMYASPNGDFAAGGYCRNTGEVQSHFFNQENADEQGFEGSVPEAMLRFIGAIPAEPIRVARWTDVLSERIQDA